MATTGPDPTVDFTKAAVAVINSVENVRGGLASRHLRILLGFAACRTGNPSIPGWHNHEQCRVSTGRRIAEALWNIFDEVKFTGPAPPERIAANLVDLHRAFRTETALRRSLGQH